MKYAFPCRITRIFENKTQKHVSGAGKDAIFETASAGWYVRIDDAFTIWLGTEKPKDLTEGMKIKLTMEPR